MKRSIRTLAILGLLSLSPLKAIPPAPLQNYCPVVVVNNTTLPASQVYFVSHGNDANGVPCFLVPDTNTGVCSYVYPTPSGVPSSAGSSVTLSQLPQATGTGLSDAYLIYLPINSSSRGYFSINKPMYLATALNPALGVIAINDSSVTSLTDPNYYTLYQDFEFGLVGNSTNSSSQIYLNLSWVDYFCLPMQLTTKQYPSNTEVVIDPTALPAGTNASMTRESIITAVNDALTAQGSPWPTLGVKFLENPYIDTTSSNYIRILAMKNSIDLGGSNGTIPFSGGNGYTPQACFPDTYFSSTTAGPVPGSSYMEEVYNYYLTPANTLWVQIFPANSPPNISPATYSISSDAGDPTNLTLNFTGQGGAPSTTLQLANLTAEKFLSGSVWTFDPPIDAAYSNELSKVVSALFTIGRFPLDPNTTGPGSPSSPPFVNNNGGFAAFAYFSNPLPVTTWTTGLWYNLYCELLHKEMISQGHVPSNPSLGLGYAYDYDDLLNMSGIINGLVIQNNYANPSQAPGAVQPYIVVTLESLQGTTIPDPNQGTVDYPVTIGSASNGVRVSFSYYHNGNSLSADAPLSGTTFLGEVDHGHPFQVTFSFDAAPEYPAPTTYTFNINLLRQVVTPVSNTSQFSAIDQYFQSGITFTNTGSYTNPALTINFNSVPPGWPG